MFYQYGILLVTIVSVTSELPSVDTVCSCAREMAPVCGSDGTTYKNECLFNCARSVNKELTLKNYGRCGEQECFCTYNYSPVCGTDGRTYGNECSLRCLKIKIPQLDVKHTGKCNGQDKKYKEESQEKEAKTLKNFVKISRHNGTVDVAHLAEKKPCSCKVRLNEVCGTDGVTYPNTCLLYCASQIYGREIKVLRSGPCKSVDNKKQQDKVLQEKKVKETQEPPKDFVKVVNRTVKVAHLPAIKPCRCGVKFNPVCGTDGVTYTNACLLNCASLYYDHKIYLLRIGPCTGVKQANPISCTCPRNYQPVCGDNGVTYDNACVLRCVGVEMLRAGPCETSTSIPEINLSIDFNAY